MSGFRERWRRWMFLSTRPTCLINPSYIIRRGLFVSLRDIAPSVTGDVLDFGCGSKPYRSLFTNADHYIGLDIEISGHDHANSQVDVFYDGKTIPFNDGRFDALVCFEVIEHIFNVEEVLPEMIRVVKPGGKVIVSVPFAWPEHEQPYDFGRYTSFGLKSLLERHGLEVLRIDKTSNFFLSTCQLFIEYFLGQVIPGRGHGPIATLARVPLVALFNLVALALNLVMPTRDGFYSGLVVVAQCPAMRDGHDRKPLFPADEALSPST